jgi:hypothetical protein
MNSLYKKLVALIIILFMVSFAESEAVETEPAKLQSETIVNNDTKNEEKAEPEEVEAEEAEAEAEAEEEEEEEEVIINLTVLMPKGETFQKVYSGIEEEMEGEYVLTIVYSEDDIDENVEALEKSNPGAIIIMDNSSVKTLKAYQAKNGTNVPVFATMMLQVENSVKELKNISGIKFEIPAFTIFSNLKYISKGAFKTVTVFYRKNFEGLIKSSRVMLARENISLNAKCIDCEKDIKPKKVYGRLKDLLEEAEDEDKLEVVWVLADNVILTPKLMKKFWIKKVVRKKVPVVVPLDGWVNPKMKFGMLAFNPDYPRLGGQISQMVREVFENESSTDEIGFEELISVYGVLNSKMAKKIKWKLEDENLDRLQKVY